MNNSGNVCLTPADAWSSQSGSDTVPPGTEALSYVAVDREVAGGHCNVTEHCFEKHLGPRGAIARSEAEEAASSFP